MANQRKCKFRRTEILNSYHLNYKIQCRCRERRKPVKIGGKRHHHVVRKRRNAIASRKVPIAVKERAREIKISDYQFNH